ncbi:uncharacterized protein Fancm [Fopius arisanus]|uniref:Uncharacterized protein Fancm n=3 Tax=Fopius arisanus TaxID=64838 RepID=A0A9R1TJK9_9HYME|nr:PREDICTED: uncharacterized protein LOC105271028 [Fopius arisanus]
MEHSYKAMDLLSQLPLLSSAEETEGFDCQAGNRWIYPENLPVRKYQFTIVKTALFNNTLVCLPTGLGKTFIAAVVMYNYFRWYPKGIIVFLAPTKPLVAQQIEACHDIMGIPTSETVELTGATNQTKRATAWREHRVIFATPQTFQKDLERSIVPTNFIKCIVIDEAHKALGKHAYSESIRMMHQANPYFRILALSATPGSKLEAVQEVIRNLRITHLELRDDTSPDIIPYINERKLEIILVGLGQDLFQFKEKYIEIMDRHVKILLQHKVLTTSTAHISKGRIFHILNEYKSRAQKSNNHGIIMKTLNILLTMYHAYELIIRHGLRAFIHFYQNHSDKFWLDNETELQELLENIKIYLGPFPEAGPFMDGSVTEVPENLVFGHGKFETLRSLLINHFKRAENKENNTRAIVFTEYRDIVNEVYILLLQCRPFIRPQVFVGQAGLKQKQQKKALEDFRSNQVNVLISTSVGEEGLDVGEVDLIVCFDISQHSPTRLVQRMGRTGRKRNGHIIVLVTDGKEHQTLQAALAKRDSMNNKVLHSSGVISALHNSSPRMIPEDIEPEVQKLHMTVLPKGPPEKKGRKRKTPLETEKKTKRASKSRNQKNSDESGKNGGQGGSLMRFLTTVSNDNDEVDDGIVVPRLQKTRMSPQDGSQPLRTNSISLGVVKQADVKLLTNDNETLEFLTLCATRQSAKDDNNNENQENRNFVIPYVPETLNCKNNFFSDLRIPDEEILNCLETVKEFEKPVEDEFTQMTPGIIFADNYSPEDFMDCGNKFEDLLDTSESDREGQCDEKESPPLESVDWKHDNINEIDDKSTEKNLRVNCVISSHSEAVVDDFSEKEIQQNSDIHTRELKSSLKGIDTRENNQFPECLTEGAFENILDESSDEDLDATQFNLESITTGVKNPEVVIESNGNKTNSDRRKVDEELINTRPMEMEIDEPIADIFSSSPVLVDAEDIEIIPLSQLPHHSTNLKPQINNVNLLNDNTEIVDIDETQIEQTIDVNYGNKIKPKLSLSTINQMKRNPQKDIHSFTGQSQVSSHSNDKSTSSNGPRTELNLQKKIKHFTSPCVTQNSLNKSIKISSHPVMNSTHSEKNAQSRNDIAEVNLTDLDDDFEFSEDMAKIETMPQVSILSECFNPQPSSSFATLTNQKPDSDTLHLPNENSKLIKAHAVERQWPSNRTSSKNSNTGWDQERNKDSTKKSFPYRADLTKALNRSQTPKQSSDKNRLISILNSTVVPGAKKSDKINKMFEDDLDDFDWSSDFEVSETKTTESKFFKGNTKTLSKISDSTGSSGEFSSSKYFNKPRDKFQNEAQPCSSLKNDKLAAIRATLFSKPSKEFITRSNSDSDDDFSSTKIEKTAFRRFSSKTSDNDPEIVNTKDKKIITASNGNNSAVRQGMPQKFDKRVRSQSRNSSMKPKSSMGKRRDRAKSNFIDDEAEESGDCYEVTDDSDEDDGGDLKDFVSHTQVHDDSVDMKAYYLQSTRSPKKRSGFHLKRPKTPPPDLQIFSQTVEPDTYLYDSFCVSASQEEDEVFNQDSSEEITIIEELDHKSRNKRKRGDSMDFKGKRRRIQMLEDDSSDDETERLRAAIFEESMMLKKRITDHSILVPLTDLGESFKSESLHQTYMVTELK